MPMLRGRHHRARQRSRLDRALFGKPGSRARGRSDPFLPLPRRIERDALPLPAPVGGIPPPGDRDRPRRASPKISPASLRARKRPIARMPPRSMPQIPDRVSDFLARGAPAAGRAMNRARAIASPPPPRTLPGRVAGDRTQLREVFHQPARTRLQRRSRPPPMMATSNVFTRLS